MKKRIINVLVVLLSSFVVLILLLKVLDLLNFKCLFKHLFGVYCAGCGTTRMIESFLSFQFYQSFRYNPLMFILFVFFIVYVLYLIIVYIISGKFKLPSFKVIIIIIIILFIYMILRNIPYFEFLRPTVLS